MPLHDVNYKHWEGTHLGVWERRWAIAKNGLGACLQNRWMWNLVVMCWGAGMIAATVLFLVGQLLVPDSVVVGWVSKFNPRLQTFVGLLTGWLANHPDISIGATQDVLFYYFCTWMLRVGIFALGVAVPVLITRDLACNAIVIYASKAVSRGDYLLGKFSTAFGLLTLTWLGPVCAAWFLGNLLSPDWNFFWHARVALENILIYGLTSMAVLSLLALGVSSIGMKEKSTTAVWFMWWILGGVIGPIALHTKQPWLRHLSFNFDLDQIALATFRVGDNLRTAEASIPILGQMLEDNNRSRIVAALDTPVLSGTWLALIVMLAVAAWIVHKRVKPE
jgi:hypothetical protein